MVAQAEVPMEWFGEFVPRVGDTLEVVVNCRVAKIEQVQIDVRGYGAQGDLTPTVGGETSVTMVLMQMRFPLHELERLGKDQ